MADKALRRPPAYQVYAADDLAREWYYGLSAGERGVLDSMHRACWVEDTVPKDPQLLARVVRLEHKDLCQCLTDRVLAHFKLDADNPERLRSLELTRQMTNLMVVRERQRQGGKEGAKITNAVSRKQRRTAQRKGSGSMAGPPAPRPPGRPTSPELNGDEENREEQNQSLRDDDSRLSQEQAEWSRDFAEAEEANATRHAPR
jgi:hypothetical protein